jgi:Recombination endonuclease VII
MVIDRSERRAYDARHYQAYRAKILERAYGISLDEYQAILEHQGGTCALCSRVPGKQHLQVDHDHAIKDRRASVRGLLCKDCNGRVLLDATSEQLRRSALYLRTPPARVVLSTPGTGLQLELVS